MIGDRYTLDREIGRGGMGAVWLGHDEVLGREVALKRVGAVSEGSGPDLLRAEREARIAAGLNHPHIVGVFDLVHDGDEQWLVMEYVAGTTLADLVRQRGALPAAEAAPLLARVASALAAAHANQVVHRDVKPSNILVPERGPVKLSDFGIARGAADASLTQTGLVTGSPAYLAPEVASGQQATAASDVWSLGASLFHALAGRPPYEVGENVLGTLYRIVHEPPPRLTDVGTLGTVLEGTMAHDPTARWTMAEVTRALEQYDQGAATGPTSVLPVAPPTPATPTPAPSAAPATAVPARGGASGAAGRRRRRRAALPAVIAAAAVALVAAVVYLTVLDGPPEGGTASRTAGDPTSEPTSPGPTSSGPTSSGPTEPSSTPPTSGPTPTEDPAPTAAEIEEFARGYVRTASSNPDAGFRLLTPAYQQQSTEYEEFWGTMSNPRILSMEANPEELTVSYTYRYQLPGGSRTEPVQLQLVRTEDGLRIAGDS